jgi:hypothetical protein
LGSFDIEPLLQALVALELDNLMEEGLSSDDAPALATLNTPNLLNAPNAPKAETLMGC